MNKKNKKKKAGVNKKDNINKRSLLLLIGCLVIFAIIALLVGLNKISWFDKGVYSLVSMMICKPMTIVFKSITILCDTETIIGILIALFIFMNNKKTAALISLNTGVCVLINQVVKHIFLRARPVGIALIKQGGYSFPSGHSMISMAFYGLFIYMIIESKMNKKLKVLFSTLLCILILSIGISRIYLGVHFASDVLGGFTLALAYLILFINLIYKKKKS